MNEFDVECPECGFNQSHQDLMDKHLKDALISELVEIFGKIEGIIENISEEIELIGEWDTKEDLVALVNQFDGYISLQKKKWEEKLQ